MRKLPSDAVALKPAAITTLVLPLAMHCVLGAPTASAHPTLAPEPVVGACWPRACVGTRQAGAAAEAQGLVEKAVATIGALCGALPWAHYIR